MAITSESKHVSVRRHGKSQFRYASVYVLITFVALFFLNIYCAKTSQTLFYQSKKATMLERCQVTASEIAGLEVLSQSSVSEAISQMRISKVNRLIVTDRSGVAVYDSAECESVLGEYVLFPEIVTATSGNNVFSWNYHAGTMLSRAAVPVYTYGTMIGCVYMTEYDTSQGMLLQSLLQNIFSITLILEILVVLFSFFFALAFSKRMHKIQSSMRIIREGDYSHKVTLNGRDELTFLAAEINNLTDRLQIAEAERRQFVSDASHELKTPLASIKLLSDSILQNEMDREMTREFVGDIGNEADRLNRMTQELLSLSRIDAALDREREILNISPTVRRVVRMLSGIAQKANIAIELTLEDNCPVLMMEDDLYQIIFNLIENGIKYNTPNGKLTVSLRRCEDTAILQFSDTGVGIPEDALNHIFERFYRVDKARSRKTGGSGLGLAIVRSMVERNHGQIQVESTVGQGSVFTVSFPIFDTEEVPE